MNATAERVRLAASALRELFRDYPTDPDETSGAVVLTITATASGEQHRLELQPGQADWMRQLAEAEASSCHRAHPDQDGQCGHCNGTGKASANPTVQSATSYPGHATHFTEQVFALAAEAGLHPTSSKPYRGAWRIYLDAKAGPQSLCGSIMVGARSGRILRAQLVHDGGAKVANHTGAVQARQALVAYANSIGRRPCR
ncbi:hypothetical protein ACFU7Y_36370 [Kitasatospora sp. NPDC057542]|uniref:hypothetical protein n=1 Tax=Kitasatospora sp. NPDC057542 TaxID=3346162 RepID=UPI0036947230